MTAPAIAVAGLVKRFPVRRSLARWLRDPGARAWHTALDSVDLEVRPGEVFGLLGPNGAGKTTLLKILGTLLLPTAGRAEIAGHDVVRHPARARARLGYALDAERSFYQRLTGIENLRFFAALNEVPARVARGRIAAALDAVGLDGAGATAVMTYSKGMQQRLGLARALLTEPEVLLLDEPTRSLDPAAAAGFRRLVREQLAGDLGKAVLLVTHSLEEARACCDRAALLHQGRVLTQGTWAEVERHLAAHGFPADGGIG